MFHLQMKKKEKKEERKKKKEISKYPLNKTNEHI